MAPFDLYAFINKHLKFRQAVDYKPQELFDFLELVKATLCRKDEINALVEVPIPLKIVGDIHGQFFDLQRIFLSFGLPGSHRYLFLGDYVDRGPHSVECMSLLFALKLAAPDRIFLLRGNHECLLINKTYGFWEEIKKRFESDVATKLYNEFNLIFTHLPLAALVRGKMLCMHGGISPRLNKVDDIRRIVLPIEEPATNTLEEDLLWSDPDLAVTGFEFNKSREASVRFGEDEVQKLCQRNNLDLIVRGHQLMANGYEFFANQRLVTLFSAPRYQLNNRGAFMVIDKNMCISFVILNPANSNSQSEKEDVQ